MAEQRTHPGGGQPPSACTSASTADATPDRSPELVNTSAVTFGEVLAGAYRITPSSGNENLRTTLLSVVSEVIPFTLETAEAYARIRGSTNIASPDAIHLACAASAGTDLFLTNDRNLVGKVIPGIQFIAGLDSNIL